MVFYLFHHYSKMHNNILERELLEKELSYKSIYYSSIDKEHERVKSVKHDMKNIMNTLSYLLEKSNAKEAKEFLNDMEYKMIDKELIVNTGNVALDTILNIKLVEAKDMDIKVKTEISIPSNIDISFEDCVILIGNIIDNAIEACNKVEVNERYINLKISYISHILYISLLNSCLNKPINKDVFFITRKKDFKWHGIGMKNIQKVIKKFDGSMNTIYDDRQFKINIVLYNIKTIITN